MLQFTAVPDIKSFFLVLGIPMYTNSYTNKKGIGSGSSGSSVVELRAPKTAGALIYSQLFIAVEFVLFIVRYTAVYHDSAIVEEL